MKKLLLITLLGLFLLSTACGSHTQPAPNDIAADSAQTDTTARLTLLFAGDLMQHITQIKAAALPDGTYDYTDCFALVQPEIETADIAIANLEVTMGGKPYRGYPCFSAPDEYLFAIRDAGFDVLLTANNHCLDSGRRGLERTVRMLDSLQIPYCGTYVNAAERSRRYPLLLEKKSFRIALLNYTYGTNGLRVQSPNVVNYIDTVQIAKDIRAAQSLRPDAIIACVHWGIEYQLRPNAEQKSLADWLLNRGVTHVIGGHPHVVQPLEIRTDAATNEKHLVVYSLGNYLSNMYKQDTDGGLMVSLTLEKDSTTRLSTADYQLVWVSRPVVSGRKVHRLIPTSCPDSLLGTRDRQLRRAFYQSARNLFGRYNRDIHETPTFRK